jgi:hypothetical protein
LPASERSGTTAAPRAQGADAVADLMARADIALPVAPAIAWGR